MGLHIGTLQIFYLKNFPTDILGCRSDVVQSELLRMFDFGLLKPPSWQFLLPRRLSRSLQGSRGWVHLLNSRRLDQCHMWHFQMPAAGAANGSHNGIPTINRLSREMFNNCFVYQEDKNTEMNWNWVGLKNHLVLHTTLWWHHQSFTIVAYMLW